jgi:GrpB-like predicted nucleotidyltransferase (UPF0157 family)
MSRIIEVKPYNPAWPKSYRHEARQIVSVLAGEIMLIHHIGSTAIPGIKAKPVIDCLSEVHGIDKIDAFNSVMMTLGYDPRGESGIPGRRYFVKRIHETHMYHLHVFQVGHPEIDRHLDFRDYLRAHPSEALSYSQLKADLAEKYRYDSVAYTEGKSAFIREIDRKATVWRE